MSQHEREGDTDPDATPGLSPPRRARHDSFPSMVRESAAKILGAGTVFIVAVLAAGTISVPMWIQTCSTKDVAQSAKSESVAAVVAAEGASKTASAAVRVATTADRELDSSYGAVKKKVDPSVEGLLAWRAERQALLERLERLEKRVGLRPRKRPPATPPIKPEVAAELAKPLPATPAAAEAQASGTQQPPAPP